MNFVTLSASLLPQENDQYLQLFLQDTPLLDVRAPVEFNKGAFPCSHNIPILDDVQRHEIGTVYADDGQDAAIERGLELATDEIREQRLAAWADYLKQHPEAHLYCFRGGLRSKTTQAWLAQHGLKTPLVKGGYKAMRAFLLQQLDTLCSNAPMLLLGGPTGTGKTLLIQEWRQSLDLEGSALHRGSAFGGTFVPQPAQIDWENSLIVDWLKRVDESPTPVLVEAESQLIGRIFVPHPLQAAMAQAPVVCLDVPIQQRIELLRDDYVSHALAHFKQISSEDPWQQLETYICDNLKRIRKRLGGVRCDQLVAGVPAAVHALGHHDDWAGIDHIIGTLLTEYYDKLYAHKMESREQHAVFRGDRQAVLQWLAENSPC